MAAKNNQEENDRIRDLMRQREFEERNKPIVGNNLLSRLYESKVRLL